MGQRDRSLMLLPALLLLAFVPVHTARMRVHSAVVFEQLHQGPPL